MATVIETINAIPHGQIFRVRFIKRTTGEVREMVCRRGVRKYVTGVGRKFNPKHKALVSVFDMQKEAYRMIPLEGVQEITANGQTHTF